MQFVGSLGIVVSRVGEIRLLERLNQQLSEENSLLRELLKEARDDEKAARSAFTDYLGLNQRVDSSIENFEPIGGHVSRASRAKELSLRSLELIRKVADNAEG